VKRTISLVSGIHCFVYLVGLLVSPAAGSASAVEPRDAEPIAAGSRVLQNAGSPGNAWVPNFRNGNEFDVFTTSAAYVRAGLCHRARRLKGVSPWNARVLFTSLGQSCSSV
jgi:hypothetical protein